MRRPLLLAALMVLAACTSGGPGPADATGTTVVSPAQELLPPHDFERLAAMFDPVVAPLGLTVARASLVDTTTYTTSPSGSHLAVYVVPDEDLDPDGYAANVVPLARAFLPLVFERWPELQSFDVCQEPYGWLGTGTPPSITVLDLDRETAAEIDWGSVDLAGLIALAGAEPSLTVSAVAEVRESETWNTSEAPRSGE